MASPNPTTANEMKNALPMRRPSTGDHSFLPAQNQQQHSVADQLHQFLLQLIPSLNATHGTNEGEQRGTAVEGGDDATTSTADDRIEFPLPSLDAFLDPNENEPKVWPSRILNVTPHRIKGHQQQKRPSKKHFQAQQQKGQRQRPRVVSPVPPQLFSPEVDQMPMFPQPSADQQRFLPVSNANEFITALQQFFLSLEIPGPSNSNCQPTTPQLTSDRMMAQMSKEFAEQAQQLLDGMVELASNANADGLLNAASLAMVAHFVALMPQSQNPQMDELVGPFLWQSLFQNVALCGDGKECDSGIGMEQEEAELSQNDTPNTFFPHPSLSSTLPLSLPSVSVSSNDHYARPSCQNQRKLVDSSLINEENAGDPLDASVLTALWLGMAQQQQETSETWEQMLCQANEKVQGQKWDDELQWRDNRAQSKRKEQSPVTNDGTEKGTGRQRTTFIVQTNGEDAQQRAMTTATERHTAHQRPHSPQRTGETNEQGELQTELLDNAIGRTEGKELRKTDGGNGPIEMEPSDQTHPIGTLSSHFNEIEFGVNRRKNPREGRLRTVGAQRINAISVPSLSTVPGTGTLTAKSEKSLGALLRQQPEGAERAEELDELEEFANFFKKQRIKHGFTQGDVGVALGKRYGTDFSQTTISRFEALNLSFKNMCKLRPLLQDWLKETDRLLSTGATVQDVLEGVALQKVASIVAASTTTDQSQRQSVQTDQSLPYFCIDEDNGPTSAASKVLPPFKKRRKRTNLDTAQKMSLDAFFRMDARPDNHRMNEIATLLDLDQDVVRVWFCNRRQKLRKL